MHLKENEYYVRSVYFDENGGLYFGNKIYLRGSYSLKVISIDKENNRILVKVIWRVL